MKQDQRSDDFLQVAVERGIALAIASGSAVAWAYMHGLAVPEAIIKRVLAYPDLRRRAGTARIDLPEAGSVG